MAINLHLEALVTLGYQHQLKKDKIGIIFRHAKQKAWDRIPPDQLQPLFDPSKARKLVLNEDLIENYDSQEEIGKL